mgnify:CR=1 FL=1
MMSVLRVASSKATDIARGVSRLLAEHGFSTLNEFSLKNSRRADVIGLDKRGTIIIVEVKSSPADFRSDAKWPEYLDHCDRFYFAVDDAFPTDILPADEGLISADKFGAEIIREASVRKVNAARRKSLTLKFARTAAARLKEFTDPPV